MQKLIPLVTSIRVSFRICIREGEKCNNCRVEGVRTIGILQCIVQDFSLANCIIMLISEGGLGACMLPQERLLNFQPLRLFLVASEIKLSGVGRSLLVISTGSPSFNNHFTLSYQWTRSQVIPPIISTRV